MTDPFLVQGPRVAVLGAGSWGTTFAKILADGGADVVLWARRPELAAEITTAKRNSDYLAGINLPRSLRATASLKAALTGADMVFLSVPSQALRSNLRDVAEHLDEHAVVVSLMKGIERGSGLRMSEVIGEVLRLPADRIAVASG
ncbi:MAG TPA: 2-dehydropantoate 2-reductase N-terminal domain-containing protein, partial [Naasia sp.]